METRTDAVEDRSALRDPGRPWLMAAILAATVASLLLLFLPLYSVTEVRHDSEAPQVTDVTTTSDRQSVIEHDGWVAVVVVVPVLICAAPLLARRRRRPATIVATVFLGVGTLLGAASFGLFYLPSLALMIVAAVKTRTPRAEVAQGAPGSP